MVELLIPGSAVYQEQGRFGVELHVVPDSHLEDRDIEQILGYAAWKPGFDHSKETYLGGRGIVIRRSSPVKKGSIMYTALQITGIGHRDLETNGIGFLVRKSSAGPFNPPSARNFAADPLAHSISSPSVDAEGNVEYSRSDFSPWGTYSSEDLGNKVRQTYSISQIDFQRFSVPPLQAYGFYTDEGLRTEEGQFGFLVMAYPARFTERLDRVVQKDPSLLSFKTSSLITAALAELHIKGYVHLQTHLGNMHMLDGNRLLISDWETLTELDGTEIQNAARRAIDILRPARDFMTLSRMLGYSMKKTDVDRLLQNVLLTYSRAILDEEMPFDLEVICNTEDRVTQKVAEYISRIDQRLAERNQ